MDTVDILACGNQRYHVTLGTKRTTVSLDNHLSLLLSLKLGHAPQTAQAQRAVRHWLQARLDEHGDYYRANTSQWLGEEVIRALVSAEVKNLYNQWIDEVLATDRSATQHSSTTTVATAVKTG
ncbi:MAG: hypothetical protein ACREUX_06595 [Burkholderiales bacterium]